MVTFIRRCTQPRGFVQKRQENMVCGLKKALHGLKQAPHANWYEKIHAYLSAYGFCNNSQTESTLYVKHVDDVLFDPLCFMWMTCYSLIKMKSILLILWLICI